MRKSKLSMEQLENRLMLNVDLGNFLPGVIDIPILQTYSLPYSLQRIVADPASVDGSGNNRHHPEWGSTDQQLLRLTSSDYNDGIAELAGASRPSARVVSNALAAQTDSSLNDRHLSDMAWLFGQFIDHDIDLTENATPTESVPIDVPSGDPFFDPQGTGNATIAFNRSVFDPQTGSGIDNPRQQINQITAFLDGSVVYGSDQQRADALRSFVGGRLKTSAGDLLPWNEQGLPNAGGDSGSLFLAGDVRANENAALTAMHTVWMREHNRWADQISAQHPALADQAIYQVARAIVTAELQAITYNEFLPALLGVDALSPYNGYQPSVNPAISNIFSTAAYRFGHSMLSPVLLRLHNDGTVIDAGNLPLEQAFFAPHQITQHGIDSLLLGAATQQAQQIDNQIVDSVRNFLFGPPGAGGFDLASLNIQRGRDHGLPSYNQARVELGLAPAESFADITSNVQLQAALQSVYGDVNDVDVWVGGLAEDHVEGASVGELIRSILVNQFERIRDGDRFWYENVFSGRLREEISQTRLSDVIQRNSNIEGLQDNVFFDPSVLYYQADNGTGWSPRFVNPAATLMSDGNDVMVVNSRTAEVLQSRPVDVVSQVILVGSDNRGNQLTINFSQNGHTMPESIYVYGSAASNDRLRVVGTPAADQLYVDPVKIRLEDHQISYQGFEFLVVNPDTGADHVYVAANATAQVSVRDADGYTLHQDGRQYVYPAPYPVALALFPVRAIGGLLPAIPAAPLRYVLPQPAQVYLGAYGGDGIINDLIARLRRRQSPFDQLI